MFLIDNDLVRAGWPEAKAVVTQILEKHGAKIQTARRWDERTLAYPIKGRRRATFLIAYYELDNDGMALLQRDLEIHDGVLRYLNLHVEALPEGEAELAKAELADDFVVPEPPADDAVDEEEDEEAESADGAAKGEGSEAKPDDAKAGDTPGAEQKDAEKKDAESGAPAEAKAETANKDS